MVHSSELPNARSSSTPAADLNDVLPFIRGLLRTYERMQVDVLARELCEAFDLDRDDNDAARILIRIAEQNGIAVEETDGVFEINFDGIDDYSDTLLRTIASRASTKHCPAGSEQHVAKTVRHLGFTRTTQQIKQRIEDALSLCRLSGLTTKKDRNV